MNGKVLDIIKLTNRLNTNFVCEYSEDDRIFILSDSGVYIITLKPIITSVFPTFCGSKHYFQISNYEVSSNVDIDINNLYPELCKDDLYESVLRTELSANLNHTSNADFYPVSAQWSPRGIEGKSDCLLAVLTNVFSLEIYVKLIDESELIDYVVIANLTKEIIEYHKPKWKASDKLPIKSKFKEFKRRIESVSPTVFTWTHVYNIKSFLNCCLIVGHMDGSVSIWRTIERKHNIRSDSKFSCIGWYKSQLTRLTSAHWRQTKEAGGVLTIGDNNGMVSVLSINNLDKNEAIISNEHLLWKEHDNIKIDKITVVDYENNSFILIVKQSYLIIYGINKVGLVFEQKIIDIGNLYITGIYHHDNKVFILTLTGVFKQLTLFVKENKIEVVEKLINLKIDFHRIRTHGLIVSKNRIFFGILTTPSRLPELVLEKQLINMYICHNAEYNPFDLLMDNPSNSLLDYWDCFETLRLLCLKEKRFPWQGINPDINYSQLSLLKLKTLRLIAKLSEEVYNLVPRITNYDIKPYILLHYMVDIKLAIERINNLLHLRNSGTELTKFQMQSIDVQNFFLKEMVVKDILTKLDVGEEFIDEIDHIMRIANELRYPKMPQCFWCGEKIIGPTCLCLHPDSRCAISMMPIIMIPGYKCPLCKCLVHKEMDNEFPIMFCPYCDVRMNQRFFKNKFINEFEKAPFQFKDLTRSAYGFGDYADVVSPCFDDCLEDTDVSIDSIEENEHDFVIFSDSDDENSINCDKLRNLYLNSNFDDVNAKDVTVL